MSKKVIPEFKKKLENENKSIYTIVAYIKDIEQFLEFCENERGKSLNKIDSKDIEAFIEEYKKRGYTLKSISRKLNSIKTFFRFCIENEYIKQNPSAIITHPKLLSKMPRVLTTQEYSALRDVCKNDQRLYSIVEILIQTGIKIGELCRVNLDDVIYDEDEIPVAIRVKQFESTLEREVPLNKAASKSTQDYLSIRPRSARSKALFVTKNGNPLLVRNIRFYLDAAFKKAGITDATVNDLRNTFIAHHLSKGTNILFISQVVGHKRVSTTEKYAKVLGINREKNKLDVL